MHVPAHKALTISRYLLATSMYHLKVRIVCSPSIAFAFSGLFIRNWYAFSGVFTAGDNLHQILHKSPMQGVLGRE